VILRKRSPIMMSVASVFMTLAALIYTLSTTERPLDKTAQTTAHAIAVVLASRSGF
jgi:hypothetical protein